MLKLVANLDSVTTGRKVQMATFYQGLRALDEVFVFKRGMIT